MSEPTQEEARLIVLAFWARADERSIPEFAACQHKKLDDNGRCADCRMSRIGIEGQAFARSPRGRELSTEYE